MALKLGHTRRPEPEPEAAVAPPVDDPVAEARAAVGALLRKELAWSERHQAQKGIIADIESRAGVALVDADDAEAALKDQAGLISQARAALDEALLAGLECWRRRPVAAENAKVIEANDLEMQAARLRDEAADLDELCRPHLEALESIQGIAFAPKPTVESRGSTAWTGVAVTTWTRSRSDALRIEAESLEQRAKTLRAWKMPMSGSVQALGVDALIAEATADAWRLAPAIPQIRAWGEAQVLAVQAKRAKIAPHYHNFVAPDVPVELTLAWKGGEIDGERSNAPELSRR